jgi:hypothetical protein
MLPTLVPAPKVAGSTSRITHDRVTRGSTVPKVLISPADAAALRALIASVRDGRVDETTIAALQEDAPPLQPLATVAIQPIAIEPLPQLALLEGERR